MDVGFWRNVLMFSGWILAEISYRGQTILYHTVNMFISAEKLGILTWTGMEFDSLLEPASSGHSRNCSFWHFHICFICLVWNFPLISMDQSLHYEVIFEYINTYFYVFSFQGRLLCGQEVCEDLLWTRICCKNHQHQEAFCQRYLNWFIWNLKAQQLNCASWHIQSHGIALKSIT